MGLFDFWKKKSEQDSYTPDYQTPTNETVETVFADEVDEDLQEETYSTLPPIPEDIFIEKEPVLTNKTMNPEPAKTVNDISLLYAHLRQNFEKQGYEDALTNPDISHMNESLENIKNQLFITIWEIKTYYNNHLKNLEFHIESRRRNGMIDTVDELLSHKTQAEDELKTVEIIEKEAEENKGLSRSLFMTYQKGFKNGVASISFGTIQRNQY